jgi:hypothetical protein
MNEDNTDIDLIPLEAILSHTTLVTSSDDLDRTDSNAPHAFYKKGNQKPSAAYKSRHQHEIEKAKHSSLKQPSLSDLPFELHEKIFVFASNPALSRVNKTYYTIGASKLTRSAWLEHFYGSNKVLACCWRWRFLRHQFELLPGISRSRHSQKVSQSTTTRKSNISKWKCQCHAVAAQSPTWDHILHFATNNSGQQYHDACEVENIQLEIVKTLLERGVNVHAGGSYALRIAVRKGHFKLAKCNFIRTRYHQ